MEGPFQLKLLLVQSCDVEGHVKSHLSMDNLVEDVKEMSTILGFPCLFYYLMNCLQGALPCCKELDVMFKLVTKHDRPKQRNLTHSLCVMHSVSVHLLFHKH